MSISRDKITVEGDTFQQVWRDDIVNSVIFTTMLDLCGYKGLDDAILMCMANGGNWFFHRIINRFGKRPLHIEYIRPRSYEAEEYVGVELVEGPDADEIKGKVIFLFDDIIDTGMTIKYVKNQLLKMGAKEVNMCVLCKREGNPIKTWNSPLLISGNKWLVGCGMDHKGAGRNLDAIYEKV